MSLPINHKRSSRGGSILGRMNQKIAIYTVTPTTDSQGGASEAEALTRTVWGAVERLTGSRAIQYAQLVNGKPYTVTLNYASDLTLTEANYFLVDSKRLQIHSMINEDLENRFWEFLVYEKS